MSSNPDYQLYHKPKPCQSVWFSIRHDSDGIQSNSAVAILYRCLKIPESLVPDSEWSFSHCLLNYIHTIKQCRCLHVRLYSPPSREFPVWTERHRMQPLQHLSRWAFRSNSLYRRAARSEAEGGLVHLAMVPYQPLNKIHTCYAIYLKSLCIKPNTHAHTNIYTPPHPFAAIKASAWQIISLFYI